MKTLYLKSISAKSNNSFISFKLIIKTRQVNRTFAILNTLIYLIKIVA